MCTEREMTLREWCDKLSQLHLVNREFRMVREAIDLLLGWIDCNAEYGIESDSDVEAAVYKALKILGDDGPIR